MRGVARGERRASPLPAPPLLAALSRESLDLLGELLRQRPASITAFVCITGRAQPNVSRSLQTLAAHGLVRLVREVRPEAIVSAVTLDLATGTYEAVPVTAMSECKV
jgi:predicted transcriptional regulator